MLHAKAFCDRVSSHESIAVTHTAGRPRWRASGRTTRAHSRHACVAAHGATGRRGAADAIGRSGVRSARRLNLLLTYLLTHLTSAGTRRDPCPASQYIRSTNRIPKRPAAPPASRTARLHPDLAR